MQGSDSYLETLSKAPERVRRRWLIVGVVTAGLAVTALFLVGPLLQDAEQAPTVREGLELSDDEHDQLDRCLKILRLREGRQDNLLPDDSWHYDAISDTHVIFFKDTRSKNPFAKGPASEGLRRARCHQDGPEYVAHLEPFVLEPQPAQDGLTVLNWGHPRLPVGKSGLRCGEHHARAGGWSTTSRSARRTRLVCPRLPARFRRSTGTPDRLNPRPCGVGDDGRTNPPTPTT